VCVSVYLVQGNRVTAEDLLSESRQIGFVTSGNILSLPFHTPRREIFQVIAQGGLLTLAAQIGRLLRRAGVRVPIRIHRVSTSDAVTLEFKL